MASLEVTSPQQWNDLVRSTRVIFVEFFAPWCGPCKAIKPELGRLAAALPKDARLVQVDIENGSMGYLFNSQNIASIPAVCVIKDGVFLPQRVLGSDMGQLRKFCSAGTVSALLSAQH